MKYKWFSLLIILFFTHSSAQELQTRESKKFEFPVVTQNSSTNDYGEKLDDIKTAIDDKEKFIELIILQLQQRGKLVEEKIKSSQAQLEKDDDAQTLDSLTNKTISQSIELYSNELDEISTVIDNFKDIHYKHLNLIQEVESSNVRANNIKLTQPYTFESIVVLNDSIEQLHQSKQELIIQKKQTNERIKNLLAILNDSTVEYTILLSDKSNVLRMYSLLRDIYLYQADLALIKFRNIKSTSQLSTINTQLGAQEKTFPLMIENIQIGESDFKELALRKEKSEKELKELIKEHKILKKNFNKTSLKAEIELSNLETKIQNLTDESSLELLQLQKHINLNKIQYTYFINNLLQQKEQALKLKYEADKFQFDWLQTFNQRNEHPQIFKSELKTWQKSIKGLLSLKSENTQFLESLNRSILDISKSQQQLTINIQMTNYYKKQQNLLEKQLEKNLKTIQRLAMQITDNNNYLTQFHNKSSRIITLLSQQLNKIELIGQWFGDKFESQSDKIKSVVYYPIASFGGKPFTLATIFIVLLYIVLGFTILRFVRKRLTYFLTKRTKLSEGASYSIATLLYYFGGFLVFLAALSAAGFNLGQMMIVFGALGVGIGFGLQNIANNFISGMILLIDRTLTVGDSITLNDGTHGKVAKLAMRYTVIRTNGGYDIIVPNSELISNRVTSMTFDDNYLRIEIPFGVSYDSDPELVKEITLEVANNVKHTINRESQKSAVLFNGLGDNSLDFVLRVWVFIYDRYRPYAIKSDYYFKLFKAFKQAGIEIPYPQRDLHIKSFDKQLLSSHEIIDKNQKS